MANQKLEQRIEKMNWKQWLPIYGIYQSSKDGNRDKPSIICGEDLTSLGYVIYQAVSGFAVFSGLSELTGRLF